MALAVATRTPYSGPVLPRRTHGTLPEERAGQQRALYPDCEWSNFGPDAVVFWNEVPQSTRFLSSQQLQVAVTEADLMQFGLAHIFVRTGGLNSNTVDFDVTAQ